jgi:hypothetical protein
LIAEIQHALGSVKVVFNLTADEESTVRRIALGDDRPELAASNLQTRLDRLPMYAMLGSCGVETSGEMKGCKKLILDFLENGHQIPRTGRPPVY